MFSRQIRQLIPGILLCIAVSAGATALTQLEVPTLGRVWLEALVLAILLGTAVRTVWSPSKSWFAGINFSAKTLLEIAVLLLGASVSVKTVMAAGLNLLGGVVGARSQTKPCRP